ncbi:ABC transporter ATP-binding protein [Mesorhizobium sp. M6A.T.Cr.TU.017.01.1.1]|uniref:ABC transporter ATP-binding protein n=1 Tax=Mesorhizobium sp. M6A.T.Cr.TU.017.01.1.1 TaxID=2496774 RepID=UPI000FD33C28|nr:ABC transporter ATP-binding protein [Mesorhizobium sp. M6A.T.Cr.TU.017.01.1.1]RUV01931.1 ABC transporter ATP-binding protein [Mesorhizobium sp. M6A.T.Cr.TU.017.01.1.1]
MADVSQPALILQGVTKAFASLVAVDAIDLELRTGEFLTLLGSSGSGKTTTLNMVAGFIKPTEGRILIDGHDATHIPPHKRGIGMVFQNYALFPHLTVGQNIGFPLTRTPKAERAGLVREALRLVGLEGLEDRFPRQLSGGQQQRIAFARAVVYRPRLLLMDEPFGALDKRLRETLQLEVRRLHQELGITILHVTHDQEEAIVLSDRIAIFSRGRIEQLDSPKGIYERPKTLFVADFIGDANIFRGEISHDGGNIAVEGDGWCLHGPSQHSGEFTAGTRAGLVVRPDKISLASVNSPITPGIQRIMARVRQVVYLGETVKYELEALDQTVYARPRADASAFAPVPGEEAYLEWRLEHGMIVQGT